MGDAGLRELRLLAKAASEAEDRVGAALGRLYPAGSKVRWHRGGHRQIGTVASVSTYRSGSLTVVNDRTGKTVRLTAFDLYYYEEINA